VDAVLETVGEATWAHSLRSLKPGGRIVVAGATSGAMPPADLRRVFFLQLSVIGSTMGTRAELEALMSFLTSTGLRPNVHQVLPLDAARDGLAAIERGEVVGKIVIEP
jgi:NADPH:quinone reductase-like Zn-dependent oxidoreductase